jgi:cell filamentation protein
MADYSLDSITDNCYPNTTVLINKFGIRDGKRLQQAEIEITQEASARWEIAPQQDTFDYEHYKAIHKYLFVDLYDWAGKTRIVNISKKGTQFCPYDKIENLAKSIFSYLRKNNYLKGLSKSNFIFGFVELYVSTNYLHPFREGNGRTQRLFLAQLARNAGYRLDFADIDVDELMIATIQSSGGVKDGLIRVFTEAILPIA